jgi:hypothetical protein
MKKLKLKLKLEDLEISTFAAEDGRHGPGTVNGMQISAYYYFESGCQYCAPSSDIGPGMPNNSCGEGCMTNNYANC